MPYHKDFDELQLRGEFDLHPPGWEPLIIEYGYDDIGGASYFFWRIRETRHTFKKAVSQLNYETGGKYRESIEEFLVGFREELVSWALLKEKPEWAIEYLKEYNDWVNL
jgi:hypothetical protein